MDTIDTLTGAGAHPDFDPAASLEPMLRRMAAAQAVVDRFNLKPIEYGTRDCIHMGALCLRKLGYPNPMKGSRPYKGEVGAVRALATAMARVNGPKGGSIADLLDAMGFDRIAPAESLPADFIGYPADGLWPVALGVAVGNGRACAYDIDGVARVGDITPAIAAWRVHPCP